MPSASNGRSSTRSCACGGARRRYGSRNFLVTLLRIGRGPWSMNQPCTAGARRKRPEESEESMEVSEKEATIGLPDASMHCTVSRMQVESSSINQAGTNNVSMNPVATESRYAPFLLHKLLPVCKPLQRQLIESAGFGFLFRLPLGLKPDPPLCIWLLSRFETQTNAIKLDGGRALSYCK